MYIRKICEFANTKKVEYSKSRKKAEEQEGAELKKKIICLLLLFRVVDVDLLYMYIF